MTIVDLPLLDPGRDGPGRVLRAGRRQRVSSDHYLALTSKRRDETGAETKGSGANSKNFDAIKASLASLILPVHPDSGCTGSMTPDASRLVNVRPCKDTFRAANGVRSKATCIGDMPCLFHASNGKPIIVTFTNVRCVPAFKFTLLSVKQLWREQRVDTVFGDTNALVLPASAGGQTLRFDAKQHLPTVRGVSAARLPSVIVQGTLGNRPADAIAPTAHKGLPAVEGAGPGTDAAPPASPDLAAPSPPLMPSPRDAPPTPSPAAPPAAPLAEEGLSLIHI